MRQKHWVTSEDTPDLAGIVRAIFRHFWWFALPLLAGMVIVLAVGMQLPPKFQGSAVVDLTTNAVLTKTMRDTLTPEYEVRKDSITESVVSEASLDQVMEDLRNWHSDGGAGSRIDLDALRSNLKHKVVVSHRQLDSSHDRIEIGFTHDNPQLVARVVNHLARIFVDRAKMQVDGEFTRAMTFFDDELSKVRIAFETLDNQRLDYEVQHSEVLNVDPATLRSAIAAKLEQKSNWHSTLAAAELRVQTINARYDITPDSMTVLTDIHDPHLTAVENELQSMRMLLAKSLGELRMREKHPDVIALREAITAAEATRQSILAKLNRDHQIPNPEKAQVAAALAAAQCDLALVREQRPTFDDQIEDLNRKLAAMVPVRTEHRDILGRIEAARRQVEFWEENSRRARLMMVTEHADTGIQLALTRPCPTSLPPISASLTTLLTAAMLIGAMFGAIVLRLKLAWTGGPDAAQEAASYDDDDDFETETDPRGPHYSVQPKRGLRIVAPMAAGMIALCLLAMLWMLYKGRGPSSAMAMPASPSNPSQMERTNTKEAPPPASTIIESAR